MTYNFNKCVICSENIQPPNPVVGFYHVIKDNFKDLTAADQKIQKNLIPVSIPPEISTDGTLPILDSMDIRAENVRGKKSLTPIAITLQTIRHQSKFFPDTEEGHKANLTFLAWDSFITKFIVHPGYVGRFGAGKEKTLFLEWYSSQNKALIDGLIATYFGRSPTPKHHEFYRNFFANKNARIEALPFFLLRGADQSLKLAHDTCMYGEKARVVFDQAQENIVGIDGVAYNWYFIHPGPLFVNPKVTDRVSFVEAKPLTTSRPATPPSPVPLLAVIPTVATSPARVPSPEIVAQSASNQSSPVGYPTNDLIKVILQLLNFEQIQTNEDGTPVSLAEEALRIFNELQLPSDQIDSSLAPQILVIHFEKYRYARQRSTTLLLKAEEFRFNFIQRNQVDSFQPLSSTIQGMPQFNLEHHVNSFDYKPFANEFLSNQDPNLVVLNNKPGTFNVVKYGQQGIRSLGVPNDTYSVPQKKPKVRAQSLTGIYDSLPAQLLANPIYEEVRRLSQVVSADDYRRYVPNMDSILPRGAVGVQVEDDEVVNEGTALLAAQRPRAVRAARAQLPIAPSKQHHHWVISGTNGSQFWKWTPSCFIRDYNGPAQWIRGYYNDPIYTDGLSNLTCSRDTWYRIKTSSDRFIMGKQRTLEDRFVAVDGILKTHYLKFGHEIRRMMVVTNVLNLHTAAINTVANPLESMKSCIYPHKHGDLYHLHGLPYWSMDERDPYWSLGARLEKFKSTDGNRMMIVPIYFRDPDDAQSDGGGFGFVMVCRVGNIPYALVRLVTLKENHLSDQADKIVQLLKKADANFPQANLTQGTVDIAELNVSENLNGRQAVDFAEALITQEIKFLMSAAPQMLDASVTIPRPVSQQETVLDMPVVQVPQTPWAKTKEFFKSNFKNVNPWKLRVPGSGTDSPSQGKAHYGTLLPTFSLLDGAGNVNETDLNKLIGEKPNNNNASPNRHKPIGWCGYGSVVPNEEKIGQHGQALLEVLKILPYHWGHVAGAAGVAATAIAATAAVVFSGKKPVEQPNLYCRADGAMIPANQFPLPQYVARGVPVPDPNIWQFKNGSELFDRNAGLPVNCVEVPPPATTTTRKPTTKMTPKSTTSTTVTVPVPASTLGPTSSITTPFTEIPIQTTHPH